jgi:hypothetical protein
LASSSGRKPDCSMRTRTPPLVGVSVQVTTVFSPCLDRHDRFAGSL